MCKSANTGLLLFLIASQWYGTKSQTGELIGDLLPQQIEDIYTILINGTVHVVGNCSNETHAAQVKYWLYQQKNPDNPILLNSFNQINARNPIVFLIYGWRGHRDSYYIQAIKNAYLPKKNYNVIIVDYGAYVNGFYFSSYCNVPLVAASFATYLCKLGAYLNINLSSIHIIGVSLGAHVAGITGNKVTCGRIGRITGLDPAGPLYQDIDEAYRLDKSDAIFVDVIHTDQGYYGYIGDCGDVDFYPNCGIYQPGCLNYSIMNAIKHASDILLIPYNLLLCSHLRSSYLYTESILLNDFSSHPCSFGCGLVLPTCVANPLGKTVYMGEYLTSKPTGLEYTLLTKGNYPYGFGPNGPTNKNYSV